MDGFDQSRTAKLREYDPQTQAIIKTTMDLIEVKMLTEDPFPNSKDLDEWIGEMWAEACKTELEGWPHQRLRITSSIQKMVRFILYILQLLLNIICCLIFSSQLQDRYSTKSL